MRKPLKSYGLVASQFALLLFLGVSGPLIARPWGWLLVEAAGIGLGVWAVLTMRLDNLQVTPDVKPAAALVRHGPYRWVRHPMYLALLLTTAPLVITAFSAWRLVAWVLLLINLLVKIDYEERLLRAHFPVYGSYQQTTKRLIPFVY
jgi:protein-S-isoprenylcysteine O-methyltransferase Ste14